MPRRPHRPVAILLGALVAVSAACSPAEDQEDASGASGSPGPDAGAGTTVPGLPGDEALSPPPPDSAAADHLERLATVPAGALNGHLTMSVSGLAAFDEDVAGTCGRPEGLPVFEAVLADGSTWQVVFGTEGATSTLLAPGVRVEQQLRETDVRVTDRVVVGALLLTAGTTEASGRVDVEFTCA